MKLGLGTLSIGRRRSEERALTAQNVPAVLLGGDQSGPAVTAQKALRIADVFACVRALTDAAASLPLIAYRRVGEGRQRLEGPLSELLTRPAPAVTQSSLLGSIMSSLQLHGDAFIGIYRGPTGAIMQLGVLDPARVGVKVEGGLPLYTVATPDGRTGTYTEADVLHVRAPLSQDGVRGLSPIAAARTAIGSAESLSQHTGASFDNAARPSGVLKVPASPTQQEEMDNLAKSFEKRHAGAGNAGRIAVLAGEVEFVQLSLSAQDAQFVEQRKLSTVEIARIFRVPNWIIGADSGESMTYSNTETQALAFVQHSLRPWLVAIEQAFTAHPDLCGEGEFVEFLLEAMLRADSKTRAEVYTAALSPTTGWLTRAEVRRLENLAPENDDAAAPRPPAPPEPTPAPEARPEEVPTHA